MVEEIKKEISNNCNMEENDYEFIYLDKLFKILDKHNYQPCLENKLSEINKKVDELEPQAKAVLQLLKIKDEEIEQLNNYKSAWEELVKSKMNIFGLNIDNETNCYYKSLNNKLQGIEKKYNLGGE